MVRPESGHSEYHLDANDLISYVSPGFLTFAQQNSAPELTADALLGSWIWSYISGTWTRELYETIFDRVRSAQCALSFPFRCDSPACRRFMNLVISPGPDRALYLSAQTLQIETRPAVILLDSNATRSKMIVTACSICKSIHVPGVGWQTVEDAIQSLELFGSDQVPMISHEVCSTCMPEFHRRMGL